MKFARGKQLLLALLTLLVPMFSASSFADAEEIVERFKGFGSNEECLAFVEAHKTELVVKTLRDLDPRKETIRTALPGPNGELTFKVVVEQIACEPGKNLGARAKIIVNAALGLVAAVPSAVIFAVGGVAHLISKAVRFVLRKAPETAADQIARSVYTKPIRLSLAFITNHGYVHDRFYPTVVARFEPQTDGMTDIPTIDPSQPGDENDDKLFEIGNNK